MPEYLSPGVYVEEVATGPRPIEGVSTSTAGFVGVTERGPTQPRLVTSWQEFERWYGGHLPRSNSFLPFSVQGFFTNGGQRAFIARITGAHAQPAIINLAAPTGSAAPGANNVLVVEAIGPGTWGNNLLVSISAASLADPNSTATRDLFRMRILYYATGIPSPFVDPTLSANLASPFRRAPSAFEDYDNLSPNEGDAEYVLSVVNVRSQLVQLQWANTTPPAAGASVPDGAPARPSDAAFGTTATQTFATDVAGLSLVLDAAGPGAWGKSIHVVIDNQPSDATLRRITITGFGRTEVFNNLDKAPLAAINARSRLVHARWSPAPPPPPGLVTANGPGGANLAGGADSSFTGGTSGNPITGQDYIGNPALPVNQLQGLAALEGIDDISLLAVPDEVRLNLTDQVTNAMIDQCERLRNRFAIVSVPENSGDINLIHPSRDSTYAAVYYPWLRIMDPATQADFTVPPAGYMAGIYASTDIDRGVHKAPANVVVSGIVTRDLGPNRKPLEFTLSKGEHDILNPIGIDVIRDFRPQGRGIRVWGARTMSSDPMWKYVNVRRLFIFVEQSIDRGTQWVVFEPNDETTWSAVVRSITGFLTTVWRSGALMGTTAAEAFFVKCDRTTMTSDDIDNGRLICLIGIAPVKPAEFVIFRISQLTADATQ
jgi:phage tail sheath protein FI